MKSIELGHVIKSFAKALDASGAADTRNKLLALGEALAGAGARSVAVSLKAAEAEPHAMADGSRHMADVLAALSEALALAKATAASSDVAALAVFFQKNPGASPAVLQAQGSRARAARGRGASAPKQSTQTAANAIERARAIANELQDLLLDARAFDARVQTLAAGRAHSKAELDAVARIFLGHNEIYPSKKKIADALIKRSKMEILGESHGRIIERTGV